MMKRRMLISIPLFGMLMQAAHASAGYELFGVVFLQPQELIEARVGSAGPLVSYIKAIGVAASDCAARSDGVPSTGFLVLAFRPGGASRVWLDFDRPIAEDPASELLSALSKVPPPATTGGTVVLAIKVGMWGGLASSRVTPSPPEWRAATEHAGHPLEVTQLVDTIWR